MAGYAFPTVAPDVNSTVAYIPSLDYAGVLAHDTYATWVLGEHAKHVTTTSQERVARYAAETDLLGTLGRVTSGPLGLSNSLQTFFGGIVLALSFALYRQKQQHLQPESKVFLVTANIFNLANVVLSIVCNDARETSREYAFLALPRVCKH